MNKQYTINKKKTCLKYVLVIINRAGQLLSLHQSKFKNRYRLSDTCGRPINARPVT